MRRILVSMEFNEILSGGAWCAHTSRTRPARDTLERIVATVRRAPSAGFSQGQRLFVVTEPRRASRSPAASTRISALAEGLEPWISSRRRR